MQKLNFPSYSFRFKSSENNVWIFDVIRKKFVILQPEEWVRQHVLHYLLYQKKYPASLISVEKQLRVNGLQKRYDIVVFRSDASIELLVECKAPAITINQETFNQIAIYNSSLDANYLMVTNGLKHYYCQFDTEERKYRFLVQIPDFSR